MEKAWRLVLLVGLLFVVGSGCGSSESTSSEADGKENRLYPWLKGPTREFLVRGGDNAVTMFGLEATEAEREQASRVVTAWMRARAVTDWKNDCRYFSRRYVKALVAEDAQRVSNGKVKNCPQALAYFGEEASGDYQNNLSGPIDSLRVGEGGQGYAQYHGRNGRDWNLPMQREDGKWLVANATPVEKEK
jgi:hypothetical protein